MTISELGALGEFISSFVVLLTLIYLTFQTRQVRAATQASVAWERARAMREMNLTWATNPEAIELLEEFGRKLEEYDEAVPNISRYRYLTTATLQTLQASYLTAVTRKDRKYEESNVIGAFSHPGFRAVWPRIKAGCHPKFVKVADAALEKY